MIENVLLGREGPHAVPQQDDSLSGIFLLGDAGQSDHVLHEQIETTRREISKVLCRWSAAAVAAMVVAIHNQPGLRQNLDETQVPADVLAEAMGDLDDAARGTAGIPTRAGVTLR